MDPYATHLPVFVAVCRSFIRLRNRCDCIEFGIGHYSTPIIQALAGESYETNEAWHKEMAILYPHVRRVQDYNDVPRRFVDFCFIDSAPESSRAELALAWGLYAEAIVLHDADSEWEDAYKYEERLVRSGMWPHVFTFTGLKPHTMLLAQKSLMRWPELLDIKESNSWKCYDPASGP